MKYASLKTTARAEISVPRHTFVRGDAFMRNTCKSLATAAAVAGLSFASLASAATSCLNQNFDAVATPALPTGWTSTKDTGAATSSPFATRGNVRYSDTGSNTAFIDDYLDYADISLYSPVFSIIPAGGTPTVTFRHSYFLWAPDEGPNYQGAFNGGVLEISINGSNFADLTSAGGSFTTGTYTTFLDSNFDNPIAHPPLSANRSVWSGDSAGFKTVTATLPASAAKAAAQLRWRLGTEGGGRAYNTYAGWWIDSVSYTSVGSDVLFRDGFEGTCE